MTLVCRLLGAAFILAAVTSPVRSSDLHFLLDLSPVDTGTAEQVGIRGSGYADYYHNAGNWEFRFGAGTWGYRDPNVPRDYLGHFRLYDTASATPNTPFVDSDFSYIKWPSDTARDYLWTSGDLTPIQHPGLSLNHVLTGHIGVEFTTSRFPNGALRGAYIPVPEPSSVALLSALFPALAVTRIRRRGVKTTH